MTGWVGGPRATALHARLRVDEHPDGADTGAVPWIRRSFTQTQPLRKRAIFHLQNLSRAGVDEQSIRVVTHPFVARGRDF